jgi:phosphoribosylaminoimidazolecarboxamide formyltransferase / IMP cyclohydrolase
MPKRKKCDKSVQNLKLPPIIIFILLHFPKFPMKPIQSALISVYYKDGLDVLARQLHALGVTIYSTGGTLAFIEALDIPVVAVEDVTAYPEIFGGRVKTLHPKIFGGILMRRDHPEDIKEAVHHEIPTLDLVIVDLYPFTETINNSGTEQEIIEKIDIGGVSLIRAAAKNFKDVVVISDKKSHSSLVSIIDKNSGSTTIEDRKKFASDAFKTIAAYDLAISNYFLGESAEAGLNIQMNEKYPLRYGENPHQQAAFYGDIDAYFDKLHGKELSYNNLNDIDSAVSVIAAFRDKPTFAIIKHTNTCGLATRDTLLDAYNTALACDPTSAFGGILISNKKIDLGTAEEINKLFCEVVIAPDFEEAALELLKSKKNRVLLRQNSSATAPQHIKSALNGYLVQDFDTQMVDIELATIASKRAPSTAEKKDLIFAIKAAKYLKSNTITLVKNEQLIGMGCGQTSRVDALKQAIEKATAFGFDLKGAVMASDAFFPFADCVEIAHQVGIDAVAHPGGSINDKLSIEYCDANDMAMVITGLRHFKH